MPALDFLPDRVSLCKNSQEQSRTVKNSQEQSELMSGYFSLLEETIEREPSGAANDRWVKIIQARGTKRLVNPSGFPGKLGVRQQPPILCRQDEHRQQAVIAFNGQAGARSG